MSQEPVHGLARSFAQGPAWLQLRCWLGYIVAGSSTKKESTFKTLKLIGRVHLLAVMRVPALHWLSVGGWPQATASWPLLGRQFTACRFLKASKRISRLLKWNLPEYSVIVRGTFHNCCCLLLIRSKLQVLPVLKRRELFEALTCWGPP